MKEQRFFMLLIFIAVIFCTVAIASEETFNTVEVWEQTSVSEEKDTEDVVNVGEVYKIQFRTTKTSYYHAWIGKERETIDTDFYEMGEWKESNFATLEVFRYVREEWRKFVGGDWELHDNEVKVSTATHYTQRTRNKKKKN